MLHRASAFGKPILRRSRHSSTSITPPSPYSLPDSPTPTVMGGLRLLDYVGTAVFSSGGSYAAACAGMDLLGSVGVGTIVAVGGGTIRDLILGRSAFWTKEHEYIWISVAAALLTLYTLSLEADSGEDSSVKPGTTESFVGSTGFRVFDSLALSTFATIGALNGLRANVPFVICALCALFTGTGGGVVRDVLTARPARSLHGFFETYAFPAFIGGGLTVAVARAVNPAAAVGTGLLSTFLLREGAVHYQWRLPSLRPDAAAKRWEREVGFPLPI